MTVRNDFDEFDISEGAPTEVLNTIPRTAVTVAAAMLAVVAAVWALSIFHMAF